MSRVSYLALVVLVVAGAMTPGQQPAAPDINQYRNHFLKEDAVEPRDGTVRVTFLGVATLLFDDGETQLMTDGFFSRPSLIQVARGNLETDPKVVDAALKKAKADRV